MNIQKLNINELRSKLLFPVDLILCSSSFEERCKTVPSCFKPDEINKILIFQNTDAPDYTVDNFNYLFSLFDGKSQKVETSINDPLKTADSLQLTLEEAAKDNSIKTILVDMTTFTHESLLILLKLLRKHCVGKKILFTYAGTTEYSVGDKIENKWLSRGVANIRTILGFPGDNSPAKKTHLIVLVGYEAERAIKMIDAIEPQSLSLGLGKSGSETTEKDREANSHFHKLVEQMAISYCDSDVKTFDIFCDDPLQTKNAIINVVENLKGRNIIIAPMNNKITTIGTALAALERPEIQICYAQPMEYNSINYSSPGKSCYLIELPELFENFR